MFDPKIVKHLQCYPEGYLECVTPSGQFEYYLGIQIEAFEHTFTIAVDIDETMTDFGIDIPLKVFNTLDKVTYLGQADEICSNLDDSEMIELFKTKTDKKYGFLPLVSMLQYMKRNKNALPEQCIKDVYVKYIQKIENLIQEADNPFSCM